MVGKWKESSLRRGGGRYEGRWEEHEGKGSIEAHLAKGLRNAELPCILCDWGGLYEKLQPKEAIRKVRKVGMAVGDGALTWDQFHR